MNTEYMKKKKTLFNVSDYKTKKTTLMSLYHLYDIVQMLYKIIIRNNIHVFQHFTSILYKNCHYFLCVNSPVRSTYEVIHMFVLEGTYMCIFKQTSLHNTLYT